MKIKKIYLTGGIMFAKGNIKNMFAVLFLIFILVSCSGKKDENTRSEAEESNQEVVQGNDISESNEDLFTVDYKEMYEELSSEGEWVKVNAADIGIDVKKGSSSGEIDLQRFLAKNILGVSDAFADDADIGMFFVWRPSADLAVSVGTDNAILPAYRPYYNGQWVNTNNGWYFAAPTPAEEIVHHYGRWYYDPVMEWVWVPGRVWSPGWVDWKENDTYVGWTPVPPGIYVTNNTISVPVIPEERYVVVEKKYFIQPQVYRYDYLVTNPNYAVVNEMHYVRGIGVEQNIIYNTGPSVVGIGGVTGINIPVVTVQRVNTITEIKTSPTEIRTYVPVFKKFKGKRKIVLNKPERYMNYEQLKTIVNEDKNSAGVKKHDQKNENLFEIQGDNDNKGAKGSDKIKSNEKKMNKNSESRENENYNKGNSDNNQKKNKENYQKENKDKSNGNKQKINENNSGKNKNMNDNGGKNKGGNDNKGKGNENKGGNKNKGKK